MPSLLDHFHPPLRGRRHWHSFHQGWAVSLSADLNARLPPRYFAEPNVQYNIEIDVAAFEEQDDTGGGFTTDWSPPEPTMTLPLVLVTDVVEILVYNGEGGGRFGGRDRTRYSLK